MALKTSRSKQLLEPRIDPETKKMDVGGFQIPPTSLLTALLYGFATHEEVVVREYYFWRVCDELWNREDLHEKLMIKHPWAKLMIRAALENKYLAVGGSASSGKSHTMAAWGIVNWLSQPQDTLVLMTSTTLREARKRIWGSVMSLLSVIDDAPIKIRDSIGNASYVNEKDILIERAGLSLISAEKSKTKEAVGKFIGIKQKRVILIGDELSELSEAILNAGLTNLSKNPSFQMIGMSNPSSRFDAFGIWSTPKDGWDSVDTNTADEWDTKWNGKYLRLDGERSPNILAGETIYPWLPTQEKLDEDKALLGVESRGYMRMVRAVFFDSDETTGIYTENELTTSGSMRPVEWQSSPISLCGIDPAFTNGGDRTIMYTAQCGYDKSGQYVIEFGQAIHLNDDATNKAVPRTYQIVRQIKEKCEKLKIPPENVSVDSTGAGAPFCDVLAGEWSNRFMRVSFGGKASEKRVSANSKLIGTELYVNRVSELWFVGKELMRTRQVFGVNSDLAQEITARNYDMVKGSTLRMKIESKPEFKSRFGRSPDLADAAFLALDCARQRLGLVAVDPPEGGDGAPLRQRRTIKSLGGALQNAEATLVD
tara:strand:+ start:15744 stop:17531 length:1788 start_codon:yes stop_codon:yes gene_type:complete